MKSRLNKYIPYYYEPLAKLTGPARMRKLLIILNAMVRDGTAWNPALSRQA